MRLPKQIDGSFHSVCERGGWPLAPVMQEDHGWFWENKTGQEVTVTLTASGFYNMSHEFRGSAPTKNKMFQ